MKKIMFNDRYGLTKAVLEGRKTMTMRMIPNKDGLYTCFEETNRIYIRKDGVCVIDCGKYIERRIKGPYKVGEIVAVAQSYRSIIEDESLRDWRIKKGLEIEGLGILSSIVTCEGFNNKMFVKAYLMPCFIQITSVRVERLQDLSDFDCLAEGVLEYHRLVGTAGEFVVKDSKTNRNRLFNTAHKAFAYLIDKVSGKGTWERNPLVWVYEFELVKQI